MIKVIFLQTAVGSCKYYRVYDHKWRNDGGIEVISYLSAVTSLFNEMGETQPVKIEFGENEILYTKKGNYILGIVTEKGKSESLQKKVKRIFREKFDVEKILKVKKTGEIWADEEMLVEEAKEINIFMRTLNLIINRKTNLEEEEEEEEEEEDEKEIYPLEIKDVDLLMTTDTGQPVYLLLTLLLPYDATLLVAFISAILDLGKAYGFGELKRLEGRNLVVYINRVSNALAIVISNNKKNVEEYKQFTTFITTTCGEWLEGLGKSVEEAFRIYQERVNFENMLKVVISSETWEKHEQREKEREMIETLKVNNFNNNF